MLEPENGKALIFYISKSALSQHVMDFDYRID